MHVAAMARKIWRANNRYVPYGFSPPNDCFDSQTNKYLFGPTRYGLTCASFVLAVFHRAGVPLVKYGTWPTSRPDDRAWQKKIVARLEEYNERLRNRPDRQKDYQDGKIHIEGIRADIGTVRFRPDEVAGATIERRVPTRFKQARNNGDRILTLLERGTVSKPVPTRFQRFVGYCINALMRFLRRVVSS